MVDESVSAPAWGHRGSAERAIELGAKVMWGARVIASGFVLPWDRQGWSGPRAARKRLGQWINGGLDGSREGSPYDLARKWSRGVTDETVSVVACDVRPGSRERLVLVGRKAGGYVYLTAALLPRGVRVAQIPALARRVAA